MVQTGTPEQILQSPANNHVARFVASADVTHVLTAGGIMKRSEDWAVLGHDGPHSVLRKMAAHSISSLFVIDGQRRFAGILYAADAERMVAEGKTDIAAITQRDITTVSPSTPIAEVMPIMAELPYPLAVVDERQKLQGVIVRGLLLAAMVEGMEAGGQNAA